MGFFKKKIDKENNVKNDTPKKEELLEKIKQLEKEIQLLKAENDFLKEELKRKEKIIKLKETLKNLDKKIILVFDPVETYAKLSDSEDPQKVETIAYNLYNLIRQQDWKYMQELFNRLKTMSLWIIIVGAGLLMIGAGVYLIGSFKQPEPKIVTQKEIIMVNDEKIKQILEENKNQVTNQYNNSNNKKYVPIEKVG